MDNVSVSPLQRLGGVQFLKFCTVGVSSTIIDKGTAWLLMKFVLPRAPWWISLTISFALGVSNGFFWNRRWTFQARGEGHAPAREQYLKFIFSNVIGWMLNITFTKLFLFLVTGKLFHEINPPPLHVIIASLCAAPIVVFWNFFANKHWTFKRQIS